MGASGQRCRVALTPWLGFTQVGRHAWTCHCGAAIHAPKLGPHCRIIYGPKAPYEACHPEGTTKLRSPRAVLSGDVVATTTTIDEPVIVRVADVGVPAPDDVTIGASALDPAVWRTSTARPACPRTPPYCTHLIGEKVLLTGGPGWVRTSDPSRVRRVLFH